MGAPLRRRCAPAQRRAARLARSLSAMYCTIVLPRKHAAICRYFRGQRASQTLPGYRLSALAPPLFCTPRATYRHHPLNAIYLSPVFAAAWYKKRGAWMDARHVAFKTNLYNNFLAFCACCAARLALSVRCGCLRCVPLKGQNARCATWRTTQFYLHMGGKPAWQSRFVRDERVARSPPSLLTCPAPAATHGYTRVAARRCTTAQHDRCIISA